MRTPVITAGTTQPPSSVSSPFRGIAARAGNTASHRKYAHYDSEDGSKRLKPSISFGLAFPFTAGLFILRRLPLNTCLPVALSLALALFVLCPKDLVHHVGGQAEILY